MIYPAGETGTRWIGNATNGGYGAMTFAGTQMPGGAGTITFGNSSTYSDNAIRLSIANTTLTIGSNMNVVGQNGVIGYASVWRGPQSISVVNEGTTGQFT